MYARVTTTQGPPERADEAVRVIKEMVIPAAEAIPGFKGGLWLLDRAGGRGIAVTLFDTQESLSASADAATKIRGEGVAKIGADIVSVETYEVAAAAGITAGVAG
jgi:hypothetical protein